MTEERVAKKTAEERRAEKAAQEARDSERAPALVGAVTEIANVLAKLSPDERARVLATVRELYNVYVPSSY